MIGRQASQLGQAVLYPSQHPLLVLLPANECALAGAYIPATPSVCILSDTANYHCLLGSSNKGRMWCLCNSLQCFEQCLKRLSMLSCAVCLMGRGRVGRTLNLELARLVKLLPAEAQLCKL